MIPIFDSHRLHIRWHVMSHTAAYTLMETLIAATIGSLILGAVMTTYVFAMKSFRAISNYVEIHSEGRMAIDLFARDVRAVSNIQSFSTNSITLTVPTSFSSSGSVTGSKTIAYELKGSEFWRTDVTAGTERKLASNVKTIKLSLYDKLGNPTTVLNTAKGIQVEIKLQKKVISQIQSEDYLSARLDMRNKP